MRVIREIKCWGKAMQKGVIKREVEIVLYVTRKSVLDKGGGFNVSRPGVIMIRKKNENRKKKTQ